MFYLLKLYVLIIIGHTFLFKTYEDYKDFMTLLTNIIKYIIYLYVLTFNNL